MAALSSGQVFYALPEIALSFPSYLIEVTRLTIGSASRFVAITPSPTTPFVMAVLIFAASLGVAVNPHARNRRLGIASLSAIACVGIVGIVLHYSTEERYYFGTWYHAELPLLLAIGIGIGVSVWSKLLNVVLAGMLCIPIAGRLLQAPSQQRAPVRPDARNLQHVIAETARYLGGRPDIRELRLASWNAGLLGFLVDTTVINLDGLANEDVVRFKAAGGSVGAYLQQERVQLLVDARLKGAPLQIDHLKLAIVHVTPWVGHADTEPGWFVMQVQK
jgi:hypothetical protein